MFVVDTSIVSLTDPTKRTMPVEFVYWMTAAEHWLYLSAVTATEVVAGIAKAKRLGAHRKAAVLESWWATTEHYYSNRILGCDLATAKVAGEITDRARAFDPGLADIIVAATAATRGFTVLTANEADFAPLGVPFINPIRSLPPLPDL